MLTRSEIDQAKWGVRFRLNEKGARGEAGFAYGVTRSLGPRTLIINGPYLAWFEVAGEGDQGPVVPFAVLVTETDMKEPEGLN